MDFIGTMIIAIGLSMDAFAVSLGVGTNGTITDNRSVIRLSFHFGLFQGLMTFLGWLAGSTIARWINLFDHWIAFILLVLVGINMIRSGINSDTKSYQNNPTRGNLMVILSLATSIDALAVGLSLALIETPIVQTALLIGITTFSLSIIGCLLGYRLGEKFGKRMEMLGGLILIGIGLRILISHLL
jgi:manganese efflux pump family protein